ncbi:MAG: hypothetical protein ACYSTG_10040 [Planctomycetota bacterium]|jgi:hypothetical protein
MRKKSLLLVSLAFAVIALVSAANASVQASDPSPLDGAEGVPQSVCLSWSPGENPCQGQGELQHFVYFTTNIDELAEPGDLSALVAILPAEQTLYFAGERALGETCYWRVDEVSPCAIAWGDIWSFTVVDHIVVDDMESYDSSTKLIYDTWRDQCAYLGCSCGSCVALETTIVHDGNQSMWYSFDNGDNPWCPLPPFSEARREFDPPLDWTSQGEKALTLWFHGSVGNDSSEMWVLLNDNLDAIVTYGDYGDDPNDIKKEEWIDWNIELADFVDAGVDLSNISSMSIGFGDITNIPVGSGIVYFDDIRLHPTRCVPKYGPAADFNGDCFVGFEDYAILASQWFQPPDSPSADIAPESPDGLVGWLDLAVLSNSWLQEQLWPTP